MAIALFSSSMLTFLHAQVVTLVPTSTRFAGTGTAGFNGDFGSETSISLNHPSYMVVDSVGNQFISDTLNNCVRKIDTGGNISTLVGLVTGGQGDTCNTAQNATPTYLQGLYQPAGLALDSNNNLYIADAGHNCIRQLQTGSAGVASLVTVAGTCGSVTSLSATPNPSGIVLDPLNNIYISIQDTEIAPLTSVYQVIRQSVAAATQATNAATRCVIAGMPSLQVPLVCSGITNSIALNAPSGLAIDFNTNLYIADTGNNCVRLVTSSALQTTAVGQCANDGTGTATTALHHPFAMVFSQINGLFITESSPDNVVLYLPGLGTLSLAGGALNGQNGTYTTAQDGISALNVTLNQPKGITVDKNNNLYVADSLNNIVRYFNQNYTFPKTSVPSLSGSQPLTYVINQAANLSVTAGPDYVITSDSCLGGQVPAPAGALPNTCQVFVRFSPTRPGIRYSPLTITDSVSGGIVATGLEGIGTGALGVFSPGRVSTIAAGLNQPKAVATDSAGNAYVLEAGTTPGTGDVRIVTPGGGSSQFTVKPGNGLLTPSGLATDAAGNWFVVDATQGTVERYGADGSVNTTFVTGLIAPSAIYVDGFGNLYIAQQGSAHNVIELYVSGLRRVVAGSGTVDGANNVPAITARLVSPGGFFIDVSGVLYIADTGGHRVYAVDQSGTIHVLAGNGTTTTTQPGVAIKTAIVGPSSIAVDAAGDLYIADSDANRVYAVYEAAVSGINIATVLGTGVAGTTGDGGAGILAQVNRPISVALDSSGNVFVVDSGSNSVRKILAPSPTLPFGRVLVGTTSPVITETFLNAGTDALSLLSAIATTDSHFGVDTPSTNCGTSILPGAFCNIGFTFTPTTTLPVTAFSILQSNSYNSPETITLTGNGYLIAPVTVTAPTATEVYGSPFLLSAAIGIGAGTTPATGTISYTVNGVTLCSFTGTVSPTTTCNAANSGLSVGTYTVTITYSGDSNYAPTTSTLTLNVTPAPLVVTANNATRPYGQPNPTFTGTLVGLVNGDNIISSYSTTATQFSPAGKYPIAATLTPISGSLANYSITNNPGTLTISPATLTVVIANVSRQYGQPNPAFTNTISGGLPGDIFTFTYSTTATQSSGVGTYPISATVAGSNLANYSVTVVPATLTITPAPLTVNVASFTRPYGTANPTLTSALVGAVNGDTFTDHLSTTATIASAPGSYPILDPITGANLANYTVTNNPGTLTITKATVALSVVVNNATRIYGAANPTFSSVTTGALNGDTFTITYATSAVATSPVGSYAIVPTVSGAAAADYTISPGNGTLTVTPAALTVVANNATRTYGSANPVFTGVLTGLLNGDTVSATYSSTATPASAAGTYPIVPAVTGAALANYTLTSTNGVLTVKPLTVNVTIVPNNATRIFGTNNPLLAGVVTGSINGDALTATFTTSATVTSPVGSYPINAILSGPNAGDYVAVVTPGALTVTAAPTLTSLSTSAASVTFGTSLTFTATVTAPQTIVAAVGAPAGTVSFFDGGTLLSGPTALNAAGVATFVSTTLADGTHPITAVYTPGSANFLTSTSGVVAQIVSGTFGITATPPTTFIRGAGNTNYAVTLNSLLGFTGPVALSCSGLPADASCAFANSPLVLTAGGTATTQMTITTTAADAKLLQQPALPSPATASPFQWALLPFAFGGFGMLYGTRRRLDPKKLRLFALLLAAATMLGISGCGCPNTAFKTYTVVVTGTSVAGTAPSASTSVVLSVGLPN
jgi:sugar lactone lactonase YvrE